MPSRNARRHEKSRRLRRTPLATAFGGSAFGLGGYGFFFASLKAQA